MRAGICTTLWAEFLFYGVTVRRHKNFTIHCDVAWLRRYKIRGIVIGSHILFAAPANEVSEWLFRHELEHAYQIIIDGTIMFNLKYFYYQLRYGYHDNPYEVDAWLAQAEPLTKTEEQLLWTLREG